MKNKKVLGGILASIAFVATVFATIPSGDQLNMTFDTSGDVAILKDYTGSETMVNVPEFVDGKPVTTIANTAFATDDENVIAIYLPITVTTVEENTFLNCSENVAVILELDNPLSPVPQDADIWGMGDYTAEIRQFTEIISDQQENKEQICL